MREVKAHRATLALPEFGYFLQIEILTTVVLDAGQENKRDRFTLFLDQGIQVIFANKMLAFTRANLE